MLGVFVGGRAQRMGGLPKGLIRPAPHAETLVERALGLAKMLDLTPCLVGQTARYAEVFPRVQMLADAPAGKGPLGGLMALCSFADERAALAVACDMPWLPSSVVARLRDYSGARAVLAPRGEGGFWEPLCARYDAPRVRVAIAEALAEDALSLQRLLLRAGVEELALSDDERAALADWDAPADLPPGCVLPRA